MIMEFVPAAVCGLLAVATVWFAARHSVSGYRVRAENADARAAALEEQSLRHRTREAGDAATLAKLQAQVEAHAGQQGEARRLADAERERNEALSRALADSRIQAETERRAMRERTILLEQVQDRAATLEMNLTAAEQARQDLNKELATLREEHRAMQGRLESQQAWVSEQGQMLRTQFGELAARLLAEQAAGLQQSNNSSIDDIVSPLRHQLAEFQARVNEVHENDTHERAGLSQLLDSLGRTQAQLSGHAEALSRSLAATPGSAATLGAVRLELQLQAAGFEQGRQYLLPQAEQAPLAIRLPDQGGYLAVDTGFHLGAWEEAAAAGDASVRDYALQRHVESLNQHLDTLGARRHADLPEGDKAVPFTLLYIPVEAAALAAVERDQRLLGRAHANRVVIATPGTLFLVVGLVAQLWRVAAQETHAQAVAAEGEELLRRLEGFTAAFGRVGAALDGARELLGAADTQLRSGEHNVLAVAQRMKLLRGAAPLPEPLAPAIESVPSAPQAPVFEPLPLEPLPA